MSTRLASVVATRQEIHLSTTFVYPPIPVRDYDWSAIDSNTYDCDWDGEQYVSRCPQGSGRTEAEAIADLFEQIEERI
jgi:hypothetical protein